MKGNETKLHEMKCRSEEVNAWVKRLQLQYISVKTVETSLFLPSNLVWLNGGRLGCRLAGMQEQQERLHFRKEQGSVKLLHHQIIDVFFLHCNGSRRFEGSTRKLYLRRLRHRRWCAQFEFGSSIFLLFWLLQIFGWKARIQCEDCHFWGILALLDLCSSGMIRLGTVRNEGLHSRKSRDGYPDFWGWRRCRHRPREDAEVPRDSRCALFALDQWVLSKLALHLSNIQWLFPFIFWTTPIARRLVTPSTIIKHYKWWLGFKGCNFDSWRHFWLDPRDRSFFLITCG